MIRDMGYYTLAKVVMVVCSFIALPIITKELGATEYGIWSQLFTTITLLSPIAAMGLPSSLLRFFSHVKDRSELCRGFSTVFVTVALGCIVIGSIVWLVATPFATIVLGNPNFATYIQYTVILLVPTVLNGINVMLLRATDRIKQYSLLVMLQSILVLLSVVILLYRGNGLWGVLIGNIVGQTVFFLLSFTVIVGHISFCRPDFHRLPEFLKFGLPLMPGSVVGWVTELSDRYLVGILLGMSWAGIYAAAYSTASVLDNMIFIIQVTLLPTLTRIRESGDIGKINHYLSITYRYYLLLIIPAVIGVTILAEPLLLILTTEEFAIGASIVGVIAIGIMFNGLGQITSNVAFIERKTRVILMAQAVGAIFNLSLNLLLIPMIGIMGAAISTLLAYGLMLMVYSRYARSLVDISPDWIFMFKCILSAAIMGLAVYLLSPSGLLQVALTVVLGAVLYMLLMLASGGIERNEMKKALMLTRR